jgi:type IV pilus assembly protein PilN
LTKRSSKIEALDKRKAELLARKAVIEQLQSSRSQMVHLFDQLVRTIPDGVRLNSIKQTGEKLTLDGVAQSNARVSSYMLELEDSGWMTAPDLSIIEAKGTDKSMPYQFALTVTLKKPKKEGEAEDEVADDAAAGGAP